MTYRADIDGLRAISVLSVIFFHTGIPGFSGGYVGVDIFFVISGYLITSVILKDIHSGQFSISRFYERRVRRIFPALFPVIVFTLIIGRFLLIPISFKVLGESITATTLFASNILFWIQSGYFDATAITKPLLHTWSLAVEEQFYIFFPLLLVAINKYSKNRYFLWISGITLISFILSIYGVYTDQVATFYLVPTRSWELLFGSILSLEVIPELKSNIQRNIVSIIGLALILFSVSFYNESTLFPGIAALAPVLGASFIIHSGKGGESIVKSLLILKPIVFIGLISYSLYLWHWPLIVFSKYLIFRDLTTIETTGILLATFIISVLSLKFIEQPFRGNQPIIPDRKKLFTLALGIMILTSITGSVIYLQNGMPGRQPEAKITDLQKTYYEENEPTLDKLQKGITPSVIGLNGAKPCFAIWGDSHAGALLTAISEMGKKYKISGYNITKSNSPPLIGINLLNDNTYLYSDEVIAFIKAHPQVKTVMIAAIWGALENGHRYKNKSPLKLHDAIVKSNQSQRVALRSGLTRTVNTLRSLGCHVIIISDVPEIGHSVWRLSWINNLLNTDINNYLPTITDYDLWNKDTQKIMQELSKNSDVTVIHPELMMFDYTGRALVRANNHLLYLQDGDHLSTEGAQYISPVFEEAFKKIINTQQKVIK